MDAVKTSSPQESRIELSSNVMSGVIMEARSHYIEKMCKDVQPSKT